MTHPSVSVVIVSRNRPDALRRCLLGVGQLQYPSFEVIVVADAQGLAAIEDVPIAPYLKTKAFDDANISVARNLGIAMSAGEVVAFIDDDAVPEPSWLTALVAPFEAPGVGATGGYVRGRNGISWQWRGRCVDRMGRTEPLEPGDPLPHGMVVKTEGTNMAVRRAVLAELCGFDEAFAFFLDETDVNVRLADAGHETVLVPEAEVHHGFFPSASRRKDRAPLDLFQIGASWAVFLRKHAPDHVVERLKDVRHAEHGRAVSHMVTGALEPRDVAKLMRSFDDGVREGMTRGFGNVERFDAPANFAKLPDVTRVSSVITCRPWTQAAARKEVAFRVKKQEIVTLLNYSATSLFHSIGFTSEGVWEHRGGIFGRSERNQPIFKLWRRSERIKAEVARVAHQRLLDVT